MATASADRPEARLRRPRALASVATAVCIVLVTAGGSCAVGQEQRKSAKDAGPTLRQAEEVDAPRLLQEERPRQVVLLLLKKVWPSPKRSRVVKEDDPRAQEERAEELFDAGVVARVIGKKKEARKAFQQAEKIQLALVRAKPTIGNYLLALSTTLTNLGLVLAEEGKAAEAFKVYRRASDVQQNLAQSASPAVVGYFGELARVLNNTGVLQQAGGKGKEALQAYTQAGNILQRLLKIRPGVTKDRNDLAKTLTNKALLLAATGKRTDAVKAHTQARQIRQKLANEQPSVTAYRHDLARTLFTLGVLLQGEEKHEKALRNFNRARDLYRRLAKDHPKDARYKKALAEVEAKLKKLPKGKDE